MGRPNPYPWGGWSSMRFIALRAPVRAKLSVSCVCLQFTLLRVCGPRRGVFTQVSSSKDTWSGDDNWLTSLPASPAPVQALLLASVVFFGWPRGGCLYRSSRDSVCTYTYTCSARVELSSSWSGRAVDKWGCALAHPSLGEVSVQGLWLLGVAQSVWSGCADLAAAPMSQLLRHLVP